MGMTWQGLDRDDGKRLRPIGLTPRAGPAPGLPASGGGLEALQPQRQSEARAAAWSASGQAAQVAPRAGRSRFGPALALGLTDDAPCRAAAAFTQE